MSGRWDIVSMTPKYWKYWISKNDSESLFNYFSINIMKWKEDKLNRDYLLVFYLQKNVSVVD